ncbi:MAG: hypothetical protein ACOX7Y_08225 [Methanosarcina sp.]
MQQPELQRYMTWIMGFGQKTASEHREFRKIVFWSRYRSLEMFESTGPDCSKQDSL